MKQNEEKDTWWSSLTPAQKVGEVLGAAGVAFLPILVLWAGAVLGW